MVDYGIRSYNVVVDYHGHAIVAGVVFVAPDVRNPKGEGWQFIPHYQGNPSRKTFATPDAALRGRVRDYTLEPRPRTK